MQWATAIETAAHDYVAHPIIFALVLGLATGTVIIPEAWAVVRRRLAGPKIEVFFEIKEAQTRLDLPAPIPLQPGPNSKWVQIVTMSATEAPLVNCETRLLSTERVDDEGNVIAVILNEPVICTWSNKPEPENRRPVTIPGKVPQAANIFSILESSTELFLMTSPVNHGFRAEMQKPGKYRLKTAVSAQDCSTEVRTPVFEWGGSYGSMSIGRE